MFKQDSHRRWDCISWRCILYKSIKCWWKWTILIHTNASMKSVRNKNIFLYILGAGDSGEGRVTKLFPLASPNLSRIQIEIKRKWRKTGAYVCVLVIQHNAHIWVLSRLATFHLWRCHCNFRFTCSYTQILANARKHAQTHTRTQICENVWSLQLYMVFKISAIINTTPTSAFKNE